MNDLVRALLAAAMHAAPTGVEQRAFTTVVHRMYRHGETNDTVARALVKALDDGLTRGNWPTSNPGGEVDAEIVNDRTPPCLTCGARLLFRAHYAAPGHGSAWKCENGHEWSNVAGEFYPPEELVHVLRPEDVR